MAVVTGGMVSDTHLTDGGMQVGHIGNSPIGAGSLTVDGGTAFSLADPDESHDPYLSVGRGNDSYGHVLITGLNSRIDMIGSDPITPDQGPTANIGRDGGKGILTIAQFGTFNLISRAAGSSAGVNVGRGLGGDGELNVYDGNLTMRADFANLRFGRDFGSGEGWFRATSRVELTSTAATGAARIVLGAAGGEGFLSVADSLVNITATYQAQLLVAAEVNTTGDLHLDEVASISVTGKLANIQIGTAAGANANVTISGGSTIVVEDTDETIFGKAFIGIGTAAGMGRADVEVTGTGSLLASLNGNVLIGHRLDVAGVGNGSLTVSDGGRIASENINVGQGGIIHASNATIDSNLYLNGGALHLELGAPVDLTGEFYASTGSTVQFDVETTAGGGLAGGGLASGKLLLSGTDMFGGFDGGDIVINVTDGTKFAANDILTLGTATGGGGFYFGNNQSAADVTVTGQAAGFGFLLSNRGSELTFKALNSGTNPGLAVLDFGATQTIGATFTYDTLSRSGEGKGGALDDILAREIDEVRGTKAGDTFTITGNGGLVLKGLGGIDTLTGAKGADALDGGTEADRLTGGGGLDTQTGGAGNDTFLYALSPDSAPGAKADRILDFDDAGNDKIDLSAVYSKTLVYVHNAAFTKAGQVRINDVAGADVVVEVNLDSDAAAEMQIRLVATTLASMGKDDFAL